MKFSPLACPVCGKLARGTVETVKGVALMEIDPDTGEADYKGYTEIWWDEQMSDGDSEGRYILICDEGHDWPARLAPEWVEVPANRPLMPGAQG
jgi:copper chaperone CopZ